MMQIDLIQHAVHKTAVEHGWWDGINRDNVPVPEKLCLIHSEISEALEQYRDNKPDIYDEEGKPEGIAVELADAIIRILDLAGFMGWDIENALLIKMAYNEKRPYRHGGKRI